MAFRILGFLRTLNRARYPLYPSSPPRFLSSPALSERFVLQQLSDLLPLDPKPLSPPIPTPNPPQQPPGPAPRPALLAPDEKLRGIFLQNLTGKSAVKAALSATGVHLTPEIFADVLNKGNLGGEPMVLFLDWAIEQPGLLDCVQTYNVVLKAMGRRKFFVFMEEILVRMRNNGSEPDSETLEIIIDSFVRARRVSKAVLLFRRLEEIGLRRDCEALNLVLKCLCRRSHVRVANSLFNSMRGELVFSTRTYNEIIGGWARFGRVDKVESYWEMMVADGLLPDNLTFAYLIEALGRAGKISDAVEVFETMEEKGCFPDTMTYNAVISNFISVGNLDDSIKYYKRMSGKNCSPDISTYDNLIGALLKVRRVADALEMFDEMLGRGVLPSTGMITSYIEPLCSFGPPHAAMMIYKKSRKAGCQVSMKAYKCLLMRLSRFGKSGMLLKLWEEMQESGYASDKQVYEYIVNGLCNIGHVDNAVLVAEESLQKGFCLGKVVYSKLNNKMLEMNKVEAAYKLLLKVKAARNIDNSRRFWRANGWHF